VHGCPGIVQSTAAVPSHYQNTTPIFNIVLDRRPGLPILDSLRDAYRLQKKAA
jgi:hypothetical protein